MDSGLVVFARYPELGKVKTRLAAGLSAAGALEFYTSCAEHVFRVVLGYVSMPWLRQPAHSLHTCHLLCRLCPTCNRQF